MRGNAKLAAIVAVLALAFTLGCGQITPEQLEGILQNVDSISGQVTVKLKDGGTVTVNLQDVKVESLRQVVGTASLEPGNPVTVQMSQDRKVTNLKAHVAEAEGFIKSIDNERQAIVIILERGGEVTLQVTNETRIEVEGLKGQASLALLQIGQDVEAKFDVQTMKALKIEVEEDEEAEAKGELEGTIIAIDVNARTITLRSENGVEEMLRLTESTRLKVDGVGIFSQLRVGMAVEADFDRTTKELVKLEVEEKGRKAEIEGIVIAIDPGKKTLTIRSKQGREETLTVVQGTRLELDGLGDFANLKVGDEIQAKFNPVSKELIKLEVED